MLPFPFLYLWGVSMSIVTEEVLNDVAPATARFFAGYNGTNIVAAFNIPGERPYVFGDIQTLTYSIHREKRPVRVLGNPDPVAFTYGPRTIAGTIIFATLDEHMIRKAMAAAAKKYGRLVADQMPPFHISIAMADEYGNTSRIALYNCTIVDEGQVFSIEDLVTETTMSYLASSIDVLSNRTTGGRGPGHVPLLDAVDEGPTGFISGRLWSDDPETELGGVRVTLLADGVSVSTYTRPNGHYTLYFPAHLEGEFQIIASQGNYSSEGPKGLPLPSVRYRHNRVRLEPKDDQYQVYGEGMYPGWDIETVRVWLNGNEITESTRYLYEVNDWIGGIRFLEPLSEDDVVEASFDSNGYVTTIPWNPPPDPSGVRGVLRDQHGRPIANATLAAKLFNGKTVTTTTDSTGAFAFLELEARIIEIRYHVTDMGSDGWMRIFDGDIPSDTADLGIITIPVSKEES